MSVGYDNISSKFLKSGAVSLTKSVTDLIDMSTDQCLFPDNLKFDELSPLYKRGNDLQKENYRPVCILIAMSKIFNDQCQIKWEHILKIYFRNSCRHSGANMDANPH